MILISAPEADVMVFARCVAPPTSTLAVSEVELAAAAAVGWFVDLALVPRGRAGHALDQELRACGTDDRCAAARLSKHGVERGLYVVVDSIAGLASVEVVDADRGRVLASDLVPLEPDLGVVEPLARKVLVEAGHRLGGRLIVEVTPSDAAVVIDPPGDAVVPGAPVTLAPGPHAIEVSAVEYETERRTVELRAGAVEILELDLEEESSVVSSWWLWTIVGVAVVAGGATLAAVLSRSGDDTVSACYASPGERCAGME